MCPSLRASARPLRSRGAKPLLSALVGTWEPHWEKRCRSQSGSGGRGRASCARWSGPGGGGRSHRPERREAEMAWLRAQGRAADRVHDGDAAQPRRLRGGGHGLAPRPLRSPEDGADVLEELLAFLRRRAAHGAVRWRCTATATRTSWRPSGPPTCTTAARHLPGTLARAARRRPGSWSRRGHARSWAWTTRSSSRARAIAASTSAGRSVIDVGVDDRALGVDRDRQSRLRAAHLGDRRDRAAGAHPRLHPAGGDAVHAVELGESVQQAPVALLGGVLVVGLSGASAARAPVRARVGGHGHRPRRRRGGCRLGGRTAAQHERGVQPGRSGGGHVGVEPVADHQRAPRRPGGRARCGRGAARACPRSRRVRPEAVSTAASSAPVPGQGPSGIGSVGSRPVASRSAPRGEPRAPRRAGRRSARRRCRRRPPPRRARRGRCR